MCIIANHTPQWLAFLFCWNTFFSTTEVAAAADTLWSAQPVCDPIAWDDFIISDYRNRILQECHATSEPEDFHQNPL